MDTPAVAAPEVPVKKEKKTKFLDRIKGKVKQIARLIRTLLNALRARPAATDAVKNPAGTPGNIVTVATT